MKKFLLYLSALLAVILLSAQPAWSRQVASRQLPKAKTAFSPISNAQSVTNAPKLSYKYIRGAEWRSPFFQTSPQSPLKLSSPFNIAYADVTPLDVELRGVLIYDSFLQSQGASYDGVYDISVNSCETPAKVFTNPNLIQGSFFADGKIYCYKLLTSAGYIYGADFTTLDAETGKQLSQVETSTAYQPLTCTYVPAMNAGLVYATDMSTGQYALVKIDLEGNVTWLADMKSADFVGGLAVGAQGVIYGLSTSGTLYTINPENWKVTAVGETGIAGKYISAMTYDAIHNLLLTSNSPENNQCSFYSIDPATAKATKRYDWDHITEFGALFIPASTSSLDAPAAPKNLSVNFEKGALSGTVSFTAPTTTYGGTPGSGALTYTVMAGDRQVASGSSSFGAGDISVPVTLTESGTVIFQVYFSNSAGDGPKSRCTTFIGSDTLSPASNPQLTYEAGSLKLTWEAAKGQNGGYIDAEKVTYRITRYVNGAPTVVAEATKALSFSEAYPEPEELQSIYYSVEALYDGAASAAVRSYPVVLGAATPPYELDLSNRDNFSLLTVINSNDDASTWNYVTVMGKGMAVYTFSMQNAADDLLIFPAVRLQKGKVYFFNFKAGSQDANNEEKLAVYVGKAPSADALTTLIEPVTSISTPMTVSGGVVTSCQEFSSQFTPEADGIYYFAIKACSDRDKFCLYVADLGISAPMATTAPGAPTELEAKADATGASKVTLTFKAPALDMAGTQLKSLEKVNIYRGKELIKSLPANPGESLSCTDENAGEGNVTYSVTGVNADGEGRAATVTTYVGVSYPAAPASASVAPGSDWGEVTVSWEAVTTDVYGLPLTDVSYIVARYVNKQWVPVSEETGTSAKIRVCEPTDEQAFTQFAVFAKNSKGMSNGVGAGSICVGKPYTMPYRESFDMKTILATQNVVGSVKWGTATDTDYENIKSVDNDNCFLTFVTAAKGDRARIFTGRIEVDANAKNPTFSFYYYCFKKGDGNTVQAIMDDGDGFKEVGSPIVIGNGNEGKWNLATISLADYKGKTVQVGIDVTAVSFGEAAFDDFRVANLVDRDLSISLSVPQAVAEGEKASFVATVSNQGALDSDNYSVDLVVNHEVVASLPGKSLKPLASRNHTFTYKVPALSPETIEVKAIVNVSADENWDNNMAGAFTIPVELSDLPYVSDLNYTVGDNGVALTWSAPDYAGYKAPELCDFEDFESWANMNKGDAKGWTFLDLDGCNVGGFEDFDIPGVPFNQPASFFIFDNSLAELGNMAASFSGYDNSHKSLAVLFNFNGERNDDWAISPELSGNKQTISFYARAYSSEYPETIQLLYSTTDRDPKSFTPVKVIEGITTDGNASWTRYEFQVPEGAKYFAIRYVSTFQFMLLIDNISFATPDSPSVSLLGYNVYCDGKKLNEKPLPTPGFTDADPMKNGRYVVTTVYNTGESRASNAVYPLGTGIDAVDAGATVRGLKGAIEVSGTDEQVSVTDMAGRVIYRGRPGRIAAPAGAYIVRFGHSQVKLLVK